MCALENSAKCKNYYSPLENGLIQKWNLNCWLNPPYGREQIKWITKACEETKKYNNTIVCLIPSRTDTKLWHDIIFPNAKVICFIKGRLKFSNSKNSAPFSSALIVFGKVNKSQIDLLKSWGKVILNEI